MKSTNTPIDNSQNSDNKILKSYVITSIFLLGASGIIYEYLFSLFGNYMMGSSYEQIFIIMGVMISSMGLGAVIQKQVDSTFEAFIFIQILLGLLGGFSPVFIYYLFVKTESYIIALYLAAALLGTLVGMEIPLLIRINRLLSKNLKDNLSEILSMDYLGSLFGSFAFVYLLLKYLAIPQIGFVTGFINTMIALLGVIIFKTELTKRKTFATFSILATILLTFGLLNAKNWTISAEQEAYRDPVIFSQTTPYQRMVLTKRNKRLRLYLNGQLQFSSEDEDIYHEMLVHIPMSVANKSKKVLILGGGDGLALREVLKYKEVNSVTLVDIDHMVVQAAKTEKNLVKLNNGSLLNNKVKLIKPSGLSINEQEQLFQRPENLRGFFSDQKVATSKVNIINIDADIFLQQINEKFNVVIIDFPDPSVLELAKLYSKEFYLQLNKHMEEDAILSIQSSSPYFANEVYLCIGKTLSAGGFQVIPYHENVPSFGEWGWYLGWKKSYNEAKVLDKIIDMEDIKVDTQYISPELARASFIFPKKWLAKLDNVRINTKMDPVLITYYNKSWNL